MVDTYIVLSLDLSGCLDITSLDLDRDLAAPAAV